MLASTGIFYSNNWPKRLINFVTKTKYENYFKIKTLSDHCIYTKETIKSEDDTNNVKKNLLKFIRIFVSFNLFLDF